MLVARPAPGATAAPSVARSLEVVSRFGIVVVVGVVLLANGCGGDDDKGSAPPKGTTTSSTTSSSTTTTSTSTTTTVPGGPGGIDPLTGAATTPVSVPPVRPTALLTTVRAARQEGFDRVVFEFEGQAPGYDVRYVPRPVHEDGSGAPIEVRGGAVVQVRMEAASGSDLSSAVLRRTYTGPTRIDPKTPEVVEIVRTGDFEAVLGWAIGVRDRVDFKVTTLTSPGRVVIDLRNH